MGRAVTPSGIPAISVVVRSTGNHPARLAEALASLAVQTRPDFEVVAVDMSGGTNDEILDAFTPQLPALRRIVLERSSRPKALNVGISAAAGEAIGILDDDNLYDPGQIETLLSGLQSSCAGYVYTGVRHATYRPDGALVSCHEVARPFALDDVLTGNFIYATGSAFHKSLWKRLGGYDERFAVLEDWDFIIRAAQAGNILHLPVISGESRKFTGREGVSNFNLEMAALRRCRAGIYWKHRRLYLSRLRQGLFRSTSAEHPGERRQARSGLLARTMLKGMRLELLVGLAIFLVHDLGTLIAKPFRRRPKSQTAVTTTPTQVNV